MTKLYIDTRNNQEVIARLDIEGTKFEDISTTENRRPESILTLIDTVCKKAGITVHEIDEIYVEEGPGSYTGLKVGVSVANALSVSLQKPVNGKVPGTIIEPQYE